MQELPQKQGEYNYNDADCEIEQRSHLRHSIQLKLSLRQMLAPHLWSSYDFKNTIARPLYDVFSRGEMLPEVVSYRYYNNIYHVNIGSFG